MPSAKTLEAGKAVIKLSLKDEVSQGLNKVGKKMQSFGAIAAGVGGSVVAAFTAATASFVSAGDQINDMATRTGFAVESLSKLSYAASQSGTSLESVERAAKGMAKTIYGASQGVEASTKTLAALGLAASDLQGLSPDQQFRKLAAAVADIKDPTTRAAMAMKVFGKSGAELLPMLAGGEAGLEAMFAEAERLGLVMSEDTATAAAELDDAFNKLTAQVKGLAVQVGSALAGPLADLGAKFSDALVGAVEFTKANPELVRAIALIGTTALVAGAGVAALGTALTVIAAHPVIAALAGITVAVIALNEALKGFSDWLADTPDAQRLKQDLEDARKVLKEMEAAEAAMNAAKNNPNPQPFLNDQGQQVGGTNGKFSNGVGWGNNTNPNKDLINLGPLSSGAAPAGGGASNLLLGDMLGKSFNKMNSGAAGAELLKQAAQGAFGWAQKQAGNLDNKFGISDKWGKAKDGFDQFVKDFKTKESNEGGMAIATLDARNAAQQFGRQSKSEELLAEIRDNTGKAAEKKGGIPVIG